MAKGPSQRSGALVADHPRVGIAPLRIGLANRMITGKTTLDATAAELMPLLIGAIVLLYRSKLGC
jgi:hypothetical protein